MKHRANPEQQLHRAVTHFLRVAVPERVVWFHVPMGGARSKTEAAIFKGLGAKAGVPDLCFVHDGAVFFIELKTQKGRLSKAQRDMIERLRMAGAQTYVCRDVPSVARVLRSQGIDVKGRV